MASAPFPKLLSTYFYISSTSITISNLSDDWVQKDDLMFLAVETANEAVSTPSGWTLLSTAQGTGTAGGVGSTRLTIFYKFIDPLVDTSVTISDSGDHQFVAQFIYRGVDKTTPINVVTGSTVPSPVTSFSFPSLTTTVDNCTVVSVITNGIDNTSTTTTSFPTGTQIIDENRNLATGGGVAVAQVVTTTAGVITGITGTLASASAQALISFALTPTTALKIAPRKLDLNTTENLVILRSTKPGAISTTTIEPFDTTPLVGSAGTWTKDASVTTTLDTGTWKAEWATTSGGGLYSPYLDLSAYEELKFDYTTYSPGTAFIYPIITVLTSDLSQSLTYIGQLVPLNTSGTVTINLNEVIRNSTNYTQSPYNFNNLNKVKVSIGKDSGAGTAGTYIKLDNLRGSYNSVKLLEAETYSLNSGLNPAGLYHNRYISTSALTLTTATVAANLIIRKVLNGQVTSLSITNPDINLKTTKRLPISSRALSLGLVSNTMSKGYGLTATSRALTLTTQVANFKRALRLSADSKTFVLTFPDTGTVVYVPSIELPVDMPLPQVIISQPVTIQVPTLELGVTPTAGFYYFYTITFTGSPVPSTHVADSKLLEADAYVDLFEIALADNQGTLYLKMNKTVEWQGNIYEGTGIQIEGVASFSDDEVARPKLSIWNPEGVFSYLVDKGTLEGALVSRIRVLKFDIDNNLPVFRKERWKLSRVVSLKKPVIICELRDMMDGQNFLTPGRMFIPPEFKTVSLS